MCAGTGPGLAIATSSDVRIRRERRAQLVGGVGDELALERKRALQPAKQLVEGVCELLELVVGAGEVQALVQVGGRDLPGGRRDRAQRPQEPPGHQPTDREREHGHDRQRDPGCDQQLMPVGAVLRDADGWVQQAPGGRLGCMFTRRSALPHRDGDRQQRGPGREEDRKEQNGETHPDRAPRQAGPEAMPGELRAEPHGFSYLREPHVGSVSLTD